MDLRLRAAALRKLRLALLNWYDRHRRALPWRESADPYRVWISEIMLQQTRVAAVLDHYARFLRRFPDVQALACARESSVLAAWSGLGYYHRARRMHRAAKVLVRQRKGRFPRTAEEWQQLPGIGRYTAAAIASIAFGEAVAVVDGNVERVLERMFAGTGARQATWDRAEWLLDRGHPGDFNQAMMELGATICTPRAPQCPACPLHLWCASRGADAARPQAARKRKQLTYGLARNNGSVLLVQRPRTAALMAGMWELPSVPPGHGNGSAPTLILRHSITDTDYEVSVIVLSPEEWAGFESAAHWVSRKQLARLALTGLARKILLRLSAAG